MSVRTYGRRNASRGIPYSDSLNDAVHDSQDTLSSQEHDHNHLYGIPFSSQESSASAAFDFDPYGFDSSSQVSFDDDSLTYGGAGGDLRKPKKTRVVPEKRDLPPPAPPPSKRRNSSRPPLIPATATLMEAQEFGEMMEHVDEVNFALDGLRRNQPVRIRRASLLSLLSICGTAQQRRLLRTQGMAKTIIDAVMGLSFDDSPCNLASAALLYALTSDGQDEHLLESPSCIKFLIRLLKPVVSTATEEKVPKIGCKLLALSMGSGILKTSKETVDRGAAEILSKVHEILLSCKELKSSYGNSGMRKQELSPKWIALLTIEKACLSTISLEETSGTVRKSGGIFKEKLRELGGLDAVFEVAMNCHSDMESWMENNLPLSQDTKIDMDMQCLSLLLKCLKIMENATFLSKDNQNHLLGMKRKITSTGSPISFTQLVMSIIKILSDLYLLKTSAVASVNEKSSALLEGTSYSFEFDFKGDDNEKFLSDASKRNSDNIYSEKGFYKFQNNKFVSTTQLDCSSSETPSTSMNDSYSLKTRLKSSASSSCSGASRSLSDSMHAAKNSLRKNLDIAQGVYDLEGAKLEVLDDSQDPFAFDEDDFEPSKWEVLSGKQNIPRSKRIGLIDREPEYGFQSRTIMSHEETSNGENNHLHEASCSTSVDEDGSSLLADCLLTAVKALMNVTNDNPVGCQQIAACGGLETMSSLIACHFPSFSSSSPSFVDLDSQNDRPLTDHELDFLVAILGLLVNLVEKDSQNRSRLASASVQLHNSELFDEGSSKDVIPLLCSIFLANQGAGEAVHEGKVLPWDDEEAVLQGEKEAEKMILEAYAALLLAFLSTESTRIRNAIADCLPDRSLAILVPVLDRFVAFHLSLNMITPETHKAVSEVIESCRGG